MRKRKIVSEANDAIAWQKTEELETEETYALCRCGQSSTKPFCDGTHARVGFDGTETADPRPTATRQRVLDGHGIVVRRDGPLCMHAAFCVGRVERIPAMLEGAADSDVRARVIALIDRCPSGSYTYSLEEGGPDVEADLPVAVAVTEEEGELAGALWVTGSIPVSRADGQPFETRNRVTLCRCGHSQNKPLCDGTHREISFRE
jgi:CDGSH-type Zn-finger protein